MYEKYSRLYFLQNWKSMTMIVLGTDDLSFDSANASVASVFIALPRHPAAILVVFWKTNPIVNENRRAFTSLDEPVSCWNVKDYNL